MLSGGRIRELLELSTRGGLVVVPRPQPEAFDGASLDLRLGRWFLEFRQTHLTAVELATLPSSSTDRLDAPLSRPRSTRRSQSGITSERKRTRQHFVPFGQGYVLHPGRFVLGVTLEWLRFPKNVAAYVTGKSSLGRHGLVIETAAGIHPNFSGCLTLELANVGEVPLEIFPGMLICQVFFHEVTAVQPKDSSRFSGRRKPVLGQASTDEIFEQLIDGERFDRGGRRHRRRERGESAVSATPTRLPSTR